MSVTDTTKIRLIEIDPTVYDGFYGDALSNDVAIPLLTRKDLQYFKTNKTSLVGKRFAEWFKRTFEQNNNDNNYIINASISCVDLLSILSDLSQGKTYKVTKPALSEKNLAMMIAFMEEHLSEQITVADIGGSCDIKERQCLRIFQDYLHVSPMQYLMSRRLEEAADLLASAKILKVSEISKKCGFVSSSYFIKLFKRAYGQTPSQYATGSNPAKQLDNPLDALSDFFG